MTVKAYFENHKDIIESELKKSKKSVKIAVAWINFKKYFKTFEDLLSNSVSLTIICSDNWQNRSHQTEIDKLLKNGADIRLIKMPRTTNHMHHKFVIIDDAIVINGSFNWSPNAEKSFENILVIENVSGVVTEFNSEFEKLKDIETTSIETLQKQNKCKEKNCDGELFNILVFSEKTSKYYETYGDIIEVCNVCENYRVLKNCIPHTQLHLMLEYYNECEDDYEIELIDRGINTLLNKYVSGEDFVIHAIGRVKTGINYPDEDFTETNIIWKNKFVGNRLQDRFDETNFGVVYDD